MDVDPRLVHRREPPVEVDELLVKAFVSRSVRSA